MDKSKVNCPVQNLLDNLDLSMFKLFTEASIHTVVIIDAHGIVQAINHSVQRDFGYAQEEVIGHNISMLMPSNYGSAHNGYLENYARTGDRKIIGIGREVSGQHKDGSQFPIHLTVSEFNIGDQKAFIGICYNISERRRLSDRILHLTAYDSLTGSLNRNQFIANLDTALLEQKEKQDGLAVLYIDLNDFKQVNDNYHHSTGDKVLLQVAERLRSSLRPEDMLGRIGGDEFIALISSNDEQTLHTVSHRILGSLEAPFYINDIPLHISASIGISLYPQHGDTSDALVSAADIAMYQAKHNISNKHICIFDHEMRVKSERSLQISKQLREAVRQERFELHYQLQFDLQSLSPSGLEALIRWRNSDNVLVPPNEFLPIAQTYGLMPELTNWVLRRACLDNNRLSEMGLLDVPVAVNVSAGTFCRDDFVQTVIDICDETNTPRNRLEIEITEDVAMHNLEKVTNHSRTLHNAELSLSMDDFGTGYSSLSRLRNLRFNKLKIDKSFINEVSKNLPNQAIVMAILGITQALGMRVVAEGIESKDQVEWLRDKGCEQGQGFWFARPLPIDKLIERLIAMPSDISERQNTNTRFL